MSSKKRKQPHPESVEEYTLKEEDGTEPHFRVRVNPAKKHELTYTSDFGPRLNLKYSVQLDGNSDVWSQLRNYKTFQIIDDNLSPIAVPVNSFIYVRGVSTAGNPDAPDDEVDFENWVAQVIECRAANRQNVFLRIVWLYWPDDLGGYGGRRDYHGELEVIPSNDMQIINAITVAGKVEVERWDDATDANYKPRQGCLFWRQTLNVHSKSNKPALLPLPREHCICNRPANPNGYLIQCKSCQRWMHEECIIENAIKEAPKAERQLGTPPKTPEVENTESTADKPTSPGTIAVEPSQGLLARVMDKVRNRHGTPQSTTAKGQLPTVNGSSQKQRSPAKKAKSSPHEGPPPSSPPKKKQKVEDEYGAHSFQAKMKETSPADSDPVPKIVISAHDANGPKREWEEPIRCIFKDCDSHVA